MIVCVALFDCIPPCIHALCCVSLLDRLLFALIFLRLSTVTLCLLFFSHL